MKASNTTDQAILRKCFPMMIAQINRKGGVMPARDVIITWGQLAVDLAVKDEKIKIMILKRATPTPSGTAPRNVTVIVTPSWDQSMPEWL